METRLGWPLGQGERIAWWMVDCELWDMEAAAAHSGCERDDSSKKDKVRTRKEGKVK